MASSANSSSTSAANAAAIANLLTLQNLMRKDPDSYREEFLQQWRHYQSLLNIFKISPTRDTAHFCDLINFLSHVRKGKGKRWKRKMNEMTKTTVVNEEIDWLSNLRTR